MTMPPLPAAGATSWTDWAAGVDDRVRPIAPPTGAASAGQVVQTSKVTGDVANRYERRADGETIVGPGGTTSLRTGQALHTIDLGNEPSRHGIAVYGSANATPGSQLMVLYDHLGAPIFAVPVDGGPAVLGDSFRVFAQGEIFYPRHKLHHNGSAQINQGDAAGSVGGIAIGAATTAPTRSPDGTETGTVAGNVLWVDTNGRLWSRRSSGSSDLVGGSNQSFFPPTGGLQGGDHWFNGVGKSQNFYDGSTWQRVAVDIHAKRSFGGNYTLATTDGYGITLHSTGATAVTVTLPQNSVADIAPEVSIPWRQWGAGQITFAAGTGATVVGRGGLLKSAGQYAEGTVTKVDVNTWLVAGDVTT